MHHQSRPNKGASLVDEEESLGEDVFEGHNLNPRPPRGGGGNSPNNKKMVAPAWLLLLAAAAVVTAAVILFAGLLSAAESNTEAGELPVPYYAYGNDPHRLILLLPDIFGAGDDVKGIAQYYARFGFTAVVLDYFNGDPYDGQEDLNEWLKRHPTALTTRYVLRSVGALRAQGYTSIQVMGYCYGGKSSVVLASMREIGAGGVQSVVVAHPSFLTTEEANWIERPMFFVMPSTDGFTQDLYPHWQRVLASRRIAAQFRVYPNTTHGFTVKATTPAQWEQKAQVLQDTLQWFLMHVDGASVVPSTGQYSFLDGVQVYQVAGARAVRGDLLYLPDINGNSSDALSLCDFFANVANYRVTLVSYFYQGPTPRNQTDTLNKTLRVLKALQYAGASNIDVTGYCWGGPPGVSLASLNNGAIGRVAVAHPSALLPASAMTITQPMFFALPQTDAFTNNGWAYFNQTLTSRGILHKGIIYLGQGHGFTVRKPKSMDEALNKTQALADTINFFGRPFVPQ